MDHKTDSTVDPVIEMNNQVLEASSVFLLMTNENRISRNRRAEWFFTHLNTIITVPREFNPEEANQELEIISVIPTRAPENWNSQTSHQFRYKVNCETVVTFLSRKYRLVYCLDVSPSVASVDVQAGIVMLDDMFEAIRNSTEALMMPFYVPGSCFLFRPRIYITVIAHGSFLASTVDQVLVQGILLDASTYSEVIKMIFNKLHLVESSVAMVSAYIHGAANKGVLERKGDEGDDNLQLAAAMSPDFGLVDLLRQALIALNLLPENSTSGLIIMTDGVISVPDGGYLDMVLSQLRYNTVSCSFVQLSSPFHPHVCYGVIPYADLVRFISTATFGAYLTTVPKIESQMRQMNPYHESFLLWTFQKPETMRKTNPFAPIAAKPGEWSVRNKCFTSVQDMPIVKKQQFEAILTVDYMKVLSSRLREGFVIKEVVQTIDNKVHIVLSLSWKFLIQVEYILTTSLPPQSKVNCSVSIEGPYDFLHDVTCVAKKQFQSYYRQLLVSRFWSSQKHLSESDKLLVHLNSFSTSPTFYNIPDSLKNGVPLFYISSNTSVPVLQPSDFAHPQFAQFWKPVCLLDTSIWQKWMHTHRIGLILEHDHLLPKHLHIPNSSGRYHVIQCRQTVMALNTLLKDWSSFVLIENHSYIKLMFNDNEKPPFSFCIIRITTKPPCMVLRLAFLVGTPGQLRFQAVKSLRELVAGITFPQRLNHPPKWRVFNRSTVGNAESSSRVLKKTWSDMPGCILLQKPIEKILIRYELPPRNFFRTLMPQHPYNTWASAKKSNNNQSTFGFRPTYSSPWDSHVDMGPEMFNTVARYLHHKRWIWCVQNISHRTKNFSSECAALILSTLTKMRLQEGLRFAFSSGGTINMVKELKMRIMDEYPSQDGSMGSDEMSYCVLQYVLFPPVSTLVSNTDDDDEESESGEEMAETYLVTECWIEPQCGKVFSEMEGSDFQNLKYSDIPDKIFKMDQECISTLLTFEHLSLMCQNKYSAVLDPNPKSEIRVKTDGEDQIKYIPFVFELSRILSRSRQAEMLFSMFNQSLQISLPLRSSPENLDKANVILYNAWCSNIKDLHDRELQLGANENMKIFHLITGRKRDTFYPCPVDTTFQNFDSENADDYPKWRCFAKWITSSQIIVTLFPATYLDLILLMLTPDTLDPKKTNIATHLLSDFSRDPGGGIKENVSKGSITTSSNSTPDYASVKPKSAAIYDRSDIPNYFFSNSEKLWNERKRNRVKSGGELMPGSGCTKELIRKTSVDNLLNVRNFSDITKKETQEKYFRQASIHIDSDITGQPVPDISCLDSSSKLNNLFPEVYGSITLPVYVYDCSLSTVNDHIIFRSSSCEEDIHIDCRVNRDDIEESICDPTEHLPVSDMSRKVPPKHLSPEPKSDDSDVAPSNKEILKSHCDALEALFSKSYILGLFETLQANIFVQPSDVQVAISFCEETKVEVDMTEFIQTLCSHMKDGRGYRPNNSNIDNSDEVTSLPPLTTDFHYEKCENLWKIQEFIKSKFQNIILSTFNLVTGCPGIYYFKLNTNQLRTLDRPNKQDSKITSDCNETGLLATNLILKPSESAPITAGLHPDIVTQETCQDLQQNHELCPPEEDVKGPLPILLYLKCNYKYEDTDISFLVHELPTCIEELLDALEIQALAPGSWNVTLKLYFAFLTVPKFMEKISCDKYLNHIGAELLSDLPLSGIVDGNANEESSVLKKPYAELHSLLPLNQLQFVTRTIEDVNWLIRDEITSFSSENSQVAEDTLYSVMSHVEQSTNKPGCMLLSIPLVFVNNSYPLGYEKFKERFQVMQSNGFAMKKNGCLYYLVKEEKNICESFGELSDAKSEDHKEELCQSHDMEGLEGVGQDGTPYRKLSGQENLKQKRSEAECHGFLNTSFQLSDRSSPHTNEDGYEGDGSESGEACAKNQTNLRKPKCLAFWMIFKLTFEQVQIYFQCRYNEYDTEDFNSSTYICQQIVKLIYSMKRIVNQDLLLQQLHDTRQSSNLLEPDNDEDDFMERYSLHDTHQRIHLNISEENDYTFTPGIFSCKVVWETKFILHPRLRTGPGKSFMSRGIQTIRATLIAFEVINRRNMFVYRDTSGNNFYLRLYKFEKSIKFNSPTKSDEQLEVVMQGTAEHEKTSEFRVRHGSVTEKELDNLHLTKNNDTSTEDLVILQVRGITAAGPEIKEHLVQSLRNKLDDSVLDILSVMLDRNPHCKLTPEDVHFIQKPNSFADGVIKYRVNSYGQQYLSSFIHYLNQNLLQFSGIPKYMDFKAENHFQDYPNANGDKGELGKNLYLYNQSTGETGSRGIACVAFSIVDSLGNRVSCSNWCRPSSNAYLENIDKEDLKSLLHTEEVEDGPMGSDVMIEFRMWKQGRINVDLLKGYLSAAIKHSMWDLVVEFHFLTAPISSQYSYLDDQGGLKKASETNKASGVKSPLDHKSIPSEFSRFETGEIGRLHPMYSKSFRIWCDLGSQLNVPSLRMVPIKLQYREAVDHLAPEIEKLISSVALDNVTKIFWKNIEDDENFTVDGLVTLSQAKRLEKRKLRYQFEMLDENLQRLQKLENLKEIEYPLLAVFEDLDLCGPFRTDDECTIISRHLRNWKANLFSTEGFTFGPEEKSQYKFLPLLDGAGHTPNFSGSTRSSFSKPDNGVFPILVSRQRLLIATVTNSQIFYVFYNWSKESCDRLVELTRCYVLWICARTSIVNSVFAQKAGIFNNQPIIRNPPMSSMCVEINPFTGGGMDVEVLLRNSVPPKEITSRIGPKRTKSGKSLTQFLECLRNVKHQCSTLKIPGVINNQVEFVETQVLNLRASDKPAILQSLYQNWLLKGPTSSSAISVEAIQTFKQEARNIHFCMTPLLFLQRWRIEVAATRDNTIGTVKKPRLINEPKKSQHQRFEVERSRHGSGTSQKSLESTKRSKSSIWGLWTNSASQIQIQNENKNQGSENSLPGIVAKNESENWHSALCDSFLDEYVQYVQTLGFVRINCRILPSKKRACPKDGNVERIRHISGASLLSTGSSHSGGSAQGFVSFVNVNQRNREYNSGEKVHCLQKTIPGGIILFEITLFEPFCCVTVYALEHERIHPNRCVSDDSYQDDQTFLENCDKMKVLMHLHSFTYDFHLRVSQSYICGKQPVLMQGYHITKFLDDFVKYYPKGPNFARNTVHTGLITVQNVSTPSHILYNYILSHEKLYNMKVVRMCTSTEEVNEYILVQISNKKVTYNDKEDEKQLDEFNLTLFLAHDAPPIALHYSVDPSVLKLKYYIILTSQLELYPKVIDLGVKGKLCVVSSPGATCLSKNLTASRSQLNEPLLRSRRESVDEKGRRCSEDIGILTSLEKEVRDMGHNHPYSGKAICDGIKEEMVHYMGYFTSHEQMMQQILYEQVIYVESHILEIVKMAAIDCRRDLLWQRLLVGGKTDDKQKQKKENLIARETIGALSYWEFGELLELVHVKSLSVMDQRVASLLRQPITFYQSLLRLITMGNQHSHRYFVAPDHSIHQMAIFSPNVYRSVILLEINLEKRTSDLSVIFKELSENEDVDKPLVLEAEILNLIESVINVCCYCSWANLV